MDFEQKVTSTEVSPSAIDESKTDHLHGDAALGFLDTHEPVSFTRQEERAVIRKIDLVLMPLVRHVSAK